MIKNKKIKNKKILFLIILVNLGLVIFLTNFFLRDVKLGGIFEWMITSIFLLFVAPFFIIKKILKENPKEYFLKSKLTLKSVGVSLIAMVIFIALMTLFVVKLNWQESLRISSWIMMKDVKLILFVDLFVLPIVILAKEFFFRGFVMKGLTSIMGASFAIIAQAFFFLFYELGVGGMISAQSMLLIIIPNIFFGFIAYKNKSIFVSTVFHWIYLLILDIYFYSQFIS